MIFDWDAANVDHIARHGVTSTECEEAYCKRPLVIKHQKRKRERRRLCLGETNNGRLLTFVVTERQEKTDANQQRRSQIQIGEARSAMVGCPSRGRYGAFSEGEKGGAA